MILDLGIKPYYSTDRGELYHADCLDILPKIPDKTVDLVLTDPPYGIGEDYASFDDTETNVKDLINRFMPLVLKLSDLTIITTGQKMMFDYPKPTWVLSWVVPEGSGCSPWGFVCWHAILAYGKDPYLQNRLGSRPDIITGQRGETTDIHPCSKPLGIWKKIIQRTSVKENDLILDPFSGSGTTAVAAEDLNRRWICIEKEEKYCELSAKRIEQFLSQGKLF